MQPVPAKRGRRPGFRMSDAHRTKIQNSATLNCLLEHVAGTREMSSTQVTAAIALLRKVLPDLSNVEHSADPDSGQLVVTFNNIYETLPPAPPVKLMVPSNPETPDVDRN
jgi:hypothetical protein